MPPTKPRARLSRELHDGLGADLTGARFALAHLDATLPADVADACRHALTLAQQAIDDALGAYRHVLDASAPMLDGGLSRTLTDWVEAFGARTGLRTSVRCCADARLAQLGEDGALAVFRVVQEALSNVARHARAGSAQVQLEARARELVVSVADDGTGFTAPRHPGNRGGGRGLAHLHARCTAFEGALAIVAREGGGTVLQARFGWDALMAGLPRRAARA
ncbi:MAG: Sensor histidine kinase LiaS [Burkholderia plantarii]|nr:MAG: Sensor histidine kinase LiaS [Burkholderia plantarii]